jgi:TPR repeat protein
LPAPGGLPAAEVAVLVGRGDAAIGSGDISSARLFYERAAEAGDGPAALRLGATYDPGFLDRAGVRGISGDPAKADFWYRRASELGEAAAAKRLENLGQPAR